MEYVLAMIVSRTYVDDGCSGRYNNITDSNDYSIMPLTGGSFVSFLVLGRLLGFTERSLQ